MIELDKKLHKDIKEYCQLNGLVMKDFVNKLLKKAFMVEKYGERPFAEPKTSNLEKEAIEKIKDIVEGQVDLPIEIAEAMEEVDFFELLGDEKNEAQAIKPVETVLDISKKEVPNNFYGTIQYDESWEEKFEENIEKGLIVTIPYRIETNCPTIVVNHSKKEKTFVQPDKVKKEEIKPIKKSRKRKLN